MLSLVQLLTAWRNVVRQVNRSRAALTAIAFGVTAMILAAGFIDWNLRFGRENTIRSQLGHVQVMKPGFLDKGRSDPFAYLLDAGDAGLEKINTLPGLVVSAPRLLISGLASSGETTLSFIGEGVDPAAEASLSSALRFPQGRNLTIGEPTTAIVGRGLAENLGIKIDMPIVLIANTDSGGVSAVEATVVGIFDSITKAYDDVALRIPIDLARQLMRAQGEHLRIVLIDETNETDRALAWLQEKLGNEAYDLVPWYEQADFYNKTAALFSKQVGVIYIIIAVIIVLAISNTMTMAVIQRVGEVGTMMAMGARRRSILVMFVTEGLVLGMIGVGIGVIVGSGLALLISAIGVPMPPGPGMTWGYDAGILLSAENIGNAAAVAMLTTGVASLYPAWKASRLGIVDALRSLQ